MYLYLQEEDNYTHKHLGCISRPSSSPKEAFHGCQRIAYHTPGQSQLHNPLGNSLERERESSCSLVWKLGGQLPTFIQVEGSCFGDNAEFSC
jgi:hypothetical protein